jgi:hypothetical protein
MPFLLQVDVCSRPETPAQFQGIGTIAIFVRGLIRAHRATLGRTTTRSFGDFHLSALPKMVFGVVG